MIVSGPSGVGKDTLLDAWMERDPSVQRVVSCTTREPRKGEVGGRDYFFLSFDEFKERVAQDRFLEHKHVHGQYYGTPRDQVDRMLATGLTAVLKIDVQGAISVMGLVPAAVTVFILPPSMEDLEDRLRNRGTESEEKIQLRLENARQEIALAERYQHRIVNDEIGRAVAELEKIKEDACTRSY